MTKKMVLLMDCGTGTDTAEFYIVPTSVTQEELDDYAWEQAVQHASSYGIYPLSDQPEDDEGDYTDDDRYSDSYSDEINGSWEDYEPKKHDGKRVGGADGWIQF